MYGIIQFRPQTGLNPVLKLSDDSSTTKLTTVGSCHKSFGALKNLHHAMAMNAEW